MLRQLIIVMVAAVVANLAAGPAWTQCLEYVAGVPFAISRGSMPSATAVAAAGELAYFNTGPVLHVADVSDPTNPQVLGEVTLPGRITAIAVDGSTSYVAMGGAGVSIVDVGNPWAPEVASSIETPWASLDVAVSGRHLYVADGLAGLGVFDVADPAHPVPVSRRAMGYVLAVAVGHSEQCLVVFVANSSGLRIMDMSDPQRPVEMGHLGRYGLASLAAAGGYGFAVDSSGRLHVIDASSPTTPVEVGSVLMNPHLARGGPVAISSSHAYVGGLGIFAVDLSETTAPQVSVGHPMLNFVNDVVWVGDVVYAAVDDWWSEQAFLAVYRACDGVPAGLGSIEMECRFHPRDFRLSDE